MNYIFFILFFFITSFNYLFSQGMDDRSKYYDYGKRFFTDAYIFNTQSPDSIKIAVYYRFSNSLLSFIKNEDRKSVV